MKHRRQCVSVFERRFDPGHAGPPQWHHADDLYRLFYGGHLAGHGFQYELLASVLQCHEQGLVLDDNGFTLSNRRGRPCRTAMAWAAASSRKVPARLSRHRQLATAERPWSPTAHSLASAASPVRRWWRPRAISALGDAGAVGTFTINNDLTLQGQSHPARQQDRRFPGAGPGRRHRQHSITAASCPSPTPPQMRHR